MPARTLANLNNILATNIVKSEYNSILPLNDQQQQQQSPRNPFQTSLSTQSHIDILKNELNKRIELQIAKQMPSNDIQNYFSNVNHSFMTSNYDSLYKRIVSNDNTNNVDLIDSMNSKFFI
jgi:hypothetical protein